MYNPLQVPGQMTAAVMPLRFIPDGSINQWIERGGTDLLRQSAGQLAVHSR